MTNDTTRVLGWVDLEVIEKQLAEISPAPWRVRACSNGGLVLQRFAPDTNDLQIVPAADAEAIVAWRNHHVQALIAELRFLREYCAGLRRVVQAQTFGDKMETIRALADLVVLTATLRAKSTPAAQQPIPEGDDA